MDNKQLEAKARELELVQYYETERKIIQRFSAAVIKRWFQDCQFRLATRLSSQKCIPYLAWIQFGTELDKVSVTKNTEELTLMTLLDVNLSEYPDFQLAIATKIASWFQVSPHFFVDGSLGGLRVVPPQLPLLGHLPSAPATCIWCDAPIPSGMQRLCASCDAKWDPVSPSMSSADNQLEGIIHLSFSLHFRTSSIFSLFRKILFLLHSTGIHALPFVLRVSLPFLFLILRVSMPFSPHSI
jgi:hypothetical protein